MMMHVLLLAALILETCYCATSRTPSLTNSISPSGSNTISNGNISRTNSGTPSAPSLTRSQILPLTPTRTGTTRTPTQTKPLPITRTPTRTSPTATATVPPAPTRTHTGTSVTRTRSVVPPPTPTLSPTKSKTISTVTRTVTVQPPPTETRTFTSVTKTRTVMPPPTGTHTFTSVTRTRTVVPPPTETPTGTSHTKTSTVPPTHSQTLAPSAEVTATVTHMPSPTATGNGPSGTVSLGISKGMTNTSTLTRSLNQSTGTITTTLSAEARSVTYSKTSTRTPTPSNFTLSPLIISSSTTGTMELTSEVSATATSWLTPTKALSITSTWTKFSPTATFEIPPPGSVIPIDQLNVSLIPDWPFTAIPDAVFAASNITIKFRLPGLFRWSANAGNYISFESVNLGCLPEFDGWHYLFQPVPCARSTMDFNVLVCNMPQIPGYRIYMTEYIAVVAQGPAFEIGSAGPITVAMLQVNPLDFPPNVLTASHGITAAVAVDVFIASLFGAQSGVFDGQFIAFAGQMSCASNLDKAMTYRMMYLVAPLTDYGNIAVVYFNMFLVGVFVTVHGLLTVMYCRYKGCVFTDACERTAFPSLSYCCAAYFHAGVAYGTAQLMLNGHSYWENVASIIGIVYVGLFHVGVMLQLGRWIRVSFVVYGVRHSYPAFVRYFLPLGFWDPKQPRQMFGRMINTQGPGAKKLTSYPILLVTAMAILSSVRPSEPNNCRVLLGIMSCGFFLVAALVAVRRPHRVPAANTTTVFMYLFMCAQVGVQAIASTDRTIDFVQAKAVLWLVQLSLVACRGAFDLAILLFEQRAWASHRVPKFAVLDEDKFMVSDQRLKDMFMDDLLKARQMRATASSAALTKRASSRRGSRRDGDQEEDDAFAAGPGTLPLMELPSPARSDSIRRGSGGGSLGATAGQPSPEPPSLDAESSFGQFVVAISTGEHHHSHRLGSTSDSDDTFSDDSML